MKRAVIYTSQTGFTQKYARLLGERLSAEVITLDEAKKMPAESFADAEAIIYGGWLMAGKITGAEWFTEKISTWRGKKLVLFGVGGSPKESPDIDKVLETALTDEQRQYAKVFYCQGGICYEKMKFFPRIILKMFTSMLRRRKDIADSDRAMAEMLTGSYDISGEEHIVPIVEYVGSSK